MTLLSKSVVPGQDLKNLMPASVFSQLDALAGLEQMAHQFSLIQAHTYLGSHYLAGLLDPAVCT
jgi:hypothetical protein